MHIPGCIINTTIISIFSNTLILVAHAQTPAVTDKQSPCIVGWSCGPLGVTLTPAITEKESPCDPPKSYAQTKGQESLIWMKAGGTNEQSTWQFNPVGIEGKSGWDAVESPQSPKSSGKEQPPSIRIPPGCS
jgi:hypothetical protein